MRRTFLLFAIALCALVSSCRGLPKTGGLQLAKPASLPKAHRLTVGQLTYVSDFNLPSDNPIVKELTAEREDIYRTLGLRPTSEPITIYLFSDAKRYGAFLASHFPYVPTRRAFFLKTDAGLAVYAHYSDRVAEDLRHEVAHGYLHAVVPEIPLWLDEGLAEYFEVPRGRGGLNRPHLALISDMMEYEGWQPALARLESLQEAAQMDQRDYAESWSWVYFMLRSDPQRREVLTAYLADLVHLNTPNGAEPISRRLAKLPAEPSQALADYLVATSEEQGVRAAASNPQSGEGAVRK